MEVCRSRIALEIQFVDFKINSMSINPVNCQYNVKFIPSRLSMIDLSLD